MKLITLTFFFILSFKSASATLHPWTDLQGRTLQAAFVKSDGVTVTINWNGKVIPIPLSTLSADSQALAKRLSAPVTPSISAIVLFATSGMKFGEYNAILNTVGCSPGFFSNTSPQKLNPL